MIESNFWRDTFGVLMNTRFLEVILLLVAALFVWAAFIRKPDDPHSHHHRRHHWRSSKRQKTESTEESKGSKGLFTFKRRRRKRRKDRPANPTLAETGGLPPVRPADPESHSKD